MTDDSDPTPSDIGPGHIPYDMKVTTDSISIEGVEGYIPIEELEALADELDELADRHRGPDDQQQQHAWHHGFGCGVGRSVNELQELIAEYGDSNE